MCSHVRNVGRLTRNAGTNPKGKPTSVTYKSHIFHICNVFWSLHGVITPPHLNAHVSLHAHCHHHHSCSPAPCTPILWCLDQPPQLSHAPSPRLPSAGGGPSAGRGSLLAFFGHCATLDNVHGSNSPYTALVTSIRAIAVGMSSLARLESLQGTPFSARRPLVTGTHAAAALRVNPLPWLPWAARVAKWPRFPSCVHTCTRTWLKN